MKPSNLVAQAKAAIEKKLGGHLSRVKFAKMLGVSVGSLVNWEDDKTEITATNRAKLEELLAKARAGKVDVPPGKRRGRPRKAEFQEKSTPKPRPKGKSEEWIDSSDSPKPIIYANRVKVMDDEHDQTVLFGLATNSGTVMTVAGVIIPKGLEIK